MHTVEELLLKHAGQRAWIFGKGPSLDDFPMESAGPLRISINESLRVVPKPTYFFAHDEGPIRNVAEFWPVDCSAILEPARAECATRCGIPSESMFVYEKRYCDNQTRDLDAAGIARRRSLYGNSGTVHCAIHFCRLIGASAITMVGFDGTGGYATKIKLPDGGAQHDRIRRDSISLMRAMGISFEFFPISAAQNDC